MHRRGGVPTERVGASPLSFRSPPMRMMPQPALSEPLPTDLPTGLA